MLHWYLMIIITWLHFVGDFNNKFYAERRWCQPASQPASTPIYTILECITFIGVNESLCCLSCCYPKIRPSFQIFSIIFLPLLFVIFFFMASLLSILFISKYVVGFFTWSYVRISYLSFRYRIFALLFLFCFRRITKQRIYIYIERETTANTQYSNSIVLFYPL